MTKRRELLKLLTVAGATTQVPDKWVKPAVDAIMLPVHAATSCNIYAVDHVAFDGQQEQERLTVCAVCNGDGSTAEVSHVTDFDDGGDFNVSFNGRTGTLATDGTLGTMALTIRSPGCSCVERPDRSASLTELTADSVVYTLNRGKGPLVVTLLRVSACPSLSPLTGDCEC